MDAVELGPVPAERRTQSPLDLFLIFAGANIVATTLVTGASLPSGLGVAPAMGLIAAGSVLGAVLVAVLAAVGPRLGVPSVIAARAAFGTRGAGLLALLLYVTNFAWIALNNVIAASACARVLGGAGSEGLWAFALGVAATAVVALGPRAVGRADRVAVPLMLGVGALMTIACLALPTAPSAAPLEGGALLPSLDLIIGYQVSWILMFADYSRYTRSGTASAVAVFLGLALTSAWFMPLGFLAARAAGSADPGAMIEAVGLGFSGSLLLGLGTLTTNFVNIYLSALAWKSLVPRSGQQAAIWSIGLLGAALSLLSRTILDGYVTFVTLLGGLLVPAGGVLLARFFATGPDPDVASLYDASPASPHAGFGLAGMAAWAAGALAYLAFSSMGGTLPALALSFAVFLTLRRRPVAAA